VVVTAFQATVWAGEHHLWHGKLNLFPVLLRSAEHTGPLDLFCRLPAPLTLT
jgi:hypothetical protein